MNVQPMKALRFILVPTIAFFFACGEPAAIDYKNKETVNQLLQEDPENAEALHARAKLYISENKADSAFYDVQLAIKLDSSKADYFITLADLYLIRNQTRSTRQMLEKAISIDPDSKEGHMKLAELYLYVEMRQEAINEVNEVLKREKTNPKAYYLKGIIYKEGGDTALALSSFLTTTEQDPNYLLAYEQLGLLFAATGNPKAISYFETAIRLDPKNALTRYNLGMFYQETGNYDAAIEVYNAISKIDPSFSNAPYNIGFIEIEYRKNPSKALPYFEQAEKANPLYAAAIYMQGVCYESMGKKPQAIELFRKSLTVSPGFELARDGLKRLGASL